MNNLATIPKDAAIAVPEPSILSIIQGVVTSGITEANVAALERLCDLRDREQAKQAERDFSAAFVALQSDMPVITARSIIPQRGKYEKFEHLMPVVGPLLIKNGFSVSFDQTADDKRITVTCHLRHISGHSTKNSVSVRPGGVSAPGKTEKGKSDSETQADCKASTIAKRNALLQALNIVVQQDCINEEQDPHIEGDLDTKISDLQAVELQTRCAKLCCTAAFLDFAKVKTFAEIPASKFDMLNKQLLKKENQPK